MLEKTQIETTRAHMVTDKRNLGPVKLDVGYPQLLVVWCRETGDLFCILPPSSVSKNVWLGPPNCTLYGGVPAPLTAAR